MKALASVNKEKSKPYALNRASNNQSVAIRVVLSKQIWQGKM
jgi:hypothetical protein